MNSLKRWLVDVIDFGTQELDDLGNYLVQSGVCVRRDGERLRKIYIGKNKRELEKFCEEFVRDGCLCWKKQELCNGAKVCPLHPFGICGADMEMRRGEAVNGLSVYSTLQHEGRRVLLAEVKDDLVKYFGPLAHFN